MFSTSSSFNPFLYTTNRKMMASSFTSAENPGFVPVLEDHHSSPFLQFSSVPFFDFDDDLLTSEFLSSQQQQMLGSNSNPKSPLETDQEMNHGASKEVTLCMENKKKMRSNVSAAKQPIPRRRTGKKDRHSKIFTAQGPRDRRMRLSLQIARKFFDLQDMLGFDKASKTIEWLFTKSKAAIKEISDNHPGMKRSVSGFDEKSMSSTSESEVVSDSGKKLKPNPSSAGRRIIAAGTDSHLSILRKKKSEKIHRRTDLKFLDRESRDKARERARERTREKLKTKGFEQSKQCPPESANNLKKLEHFSLLENAQKLVPGNQELNSVLEMGSVSITNKCLEIKGAATSSSGLNFFHNSAVSSGTNLDADEILGFPSNWDLSNARMQHRYSGAMPSMKPPAGNPNENFMMTNPTAHEQSLTSIFMNTVSSHSQEEYYHGSSAFMNIQDSNVQNPNCIFMTSNSSLIIGNKYDSLFGNA